MKKAASKARANKPLRQAEPEKCFWVCDGTVLQDLKELVDALEKMSADIFKRHVNAAKNDFAKWISEVLDESGLAKSIAKSRTAKAMAKKIKVRI